MRVYSKIKTHWRINRYQLYFDLDNITALIFLTFFLISKDQNKSHLKNKIKKLKNTVFFNQNFKKLTKLY